MWMPRVTVALLTNQQTRKLLWLGRHKPLYSCGSWIYWSSFTDRHDRNQNQTWFRYLPFLKASRTQKIGWKTKTKPCSGAVSPEGEPSSAAARSNPRAERYTHSSLRRGVVTTTTRPPLLSHVSEQSGNQYWGMDQLIEPGGSKTSFYHFGALLNSSQIPSISCQSCASVLKLVPAVFTVCKPQRGAGRSKFGNSTNGFC